MGEGPDYASMTVAETLKHLNTTERGLSQEESRKRLEKYGKNELTLKTRMPPWLMFLTQFREVLVIVLIIAGIISFAIGSYRDGVVMFVIVFINAIIGFVQQYKAEKILEQLKNLIRSPAKVMVDGNLTEKRQEELVPGDVVVLDEGDKVPGDIRIIESFNLRTNDFSLTGESMPQEKHSNTVEPDLALGDKDNMVFVGTTVASGNATGVVVATGMDTELGKIAFMTQETSETRSPLQKELGHLGNRLTALVVVLSAALFGIALLQGFPFFFSLIYALGIAVAAVPQALPAQVTVALTTASKRLADERAVVKNLASVETLGSTNVICTDKTGTLTKNEMTVRAVWFDGIRYTVTGLGYEPTGTLIKPDGKEVTQEEIDEIEVMMDAATMASNAEIHPPDDDHHGWYPIGDPTEAALITLSMKLGTRSPIEDEENPELHEFPFDSERKRMSSVRQFGERQVLTMKGALDSVLGVSRFIHKVKFIYKDGKAVPITDEDKLAIHDVSEEYARQAMRVIAVAYRPLETTGKDYVMEELEKDVIFLGLVGMTDPPKEGVKEAIDTAHRAHIRTFIMTGDHAITAQAIGREIELADEGGDSPVITGRELHAMDDRTLITTMKENNSLIFSRVDPADKLRIVKLLEDQHQVVAVTGDGVNDAPALKRADIGVAMGRTGTDVAKEASELVLLDDSFPTLVNAVREGRTIYNNLKKTVIASMTTNGAELAIVLLGLASVALWGWAIPMMAIQILAIDLIAEIAPLTCLTFDPPGEGIMSSPPRDQKEHMLTTATSLEIIFFGFLMGMLAFVNFALFMQREGVILTMDNFGAHPAIYARATAIAFVTIAMCQFANILSRRYEHTSLFNRNFFTNRILLASIAISIGLILMVVHVPVVRDFLAFGPLSIVDYMYVLGATGLFVLSFEVMKLIKRFRLKKN